MKLNLKGVDLDDGLKMEVEQGVNGAIRINCYADGDLTMTTDVNRDGFTDEFCRMFGDLDMDIEDLAFGHDITVAKGYTMEDVAEEMLEKL